MRTWKVLAPIACAMMALLLTGCSADAEPSPQVSHESTPGATKEPVTVVDNTEAPEEPTPSKTIDPDPVLMEEMSCEPVSPEVLDRIKQGFGTPTRSTQVRVGEGLEPGEEWWVVILDTPPDDTLHWGLRSFLTTAPGLAEDGKWIQLGPKAEPWSSVNWAPEQLVVGQSALEKALSCLED